VTSSSDMLASTTCHIEGSSARSLSNTVLTCRETAPIINFNLLSHAETASNQKYWADDWADEGKRLTCRPASR